MRQGRLKLDLPYSLCISSPFYSGQLYALLNTPEHATFNQLSMRNNKQIPIFEAHINVRNCMGAFPCA